jgi:hypothetical protein
MKLAHNQLIIDIDGEDEMKLLKALYMFSWIKRRVVKTNRGYHIYLDLPHSFELRALFGDDPKRLEVDESNAKRRSRCYINVAFKSTELYEI